MNNGTGRTLFPSKRTTYLVLTLALCLTWAVIVLWPQLSDWYRVANDFQNHYWLAKFQDPGLFPDDRLQWADDLIRIKILGEVVIVYPLSVGYGLLFYFASAIIEPILFGKLLVFFLLPISVYYLFRIGTKLKRKGNGVVLGLLFTFIIFASPDSISIASGLQRAFALPLLIVFVYYLLTSKYIGAAALIVVGALFYLPIVPIMVLGYGFEFLWLRWKPTEIEIDFSRNKVLPFLAAMGIVLLVAGWAISTRFDRLSSPTGEGQISEPSLLADPRRSIGGPVPLYIRFPWLGRAGFFDIDRDVVNFLVLIILSAMILIFVDRKEITKLPCVVQRVLYAGVILYILSLFVLVTFNSTLLYLPSRYTRVVLILCPLIFVGLNLGKLLEAMRERMKQDFKSTLIGLVLVLLGILALFFWLKSLLLTLSVLGVMAIVLPGLAVSLIVNLQPRQFGVLGVLLAGLILILTLIPGFLYSRSLGVFCIDPSKHEREIFQYAATLPKEVVFAGSPEELTGIPLFSKRTVLFRRLFPAKDAPIIPMFDAYYAENGEDVLAFCRQYEVDYWLIDEDDYNTEYLMAGEFFFQPYNAEIQDIISSREYFALPQAEKVFESGDLAVVPCSPEAILSGEGD